jgi:D-3-phosphoglycerate dehydrogenase / 2-oxoglutarate reductase
MAAQLDKTVLIATEKPFSADAKDTAINIMKGAGLNVAVFEDYVPKDAPKGYAKQALIGELNKQGANAVIIRSDVVDADVYNSVKSLELIVRAGSGYDNIKNLEIAEQKSITAETTPGQNANGVADLALQLILRHIRPLDGKNGNELKGKTIGIHGFGNIGSIVAKHGVYLGNDVKVFDEYLNKDRAKELGVQIIGSDQELYRNADIVSLHIPLNDKTKGVVGYDLMQLMSKDGILINTARAGIVDEAGLKKIMSERKKFRYAADVIENDDIAQRMKALEEEFPDRVIVTKKKQGAQTDEANYNTAVASARQCVDYFVNGIVTNNVNNPLPNGMRDYAVLAQILGSMNKSIGGVPKLVDVTCYGGLAKHKDQIGQYVLKGLFEGDLGRVLIPSEAQKTADEKEVNYIFRSLDRVPSLDVGITYLDKADNQHCITGRIDGKELQVTGIDGFKLIIPVKPYECIIAEYLEQAGIADKIGDAFTRNGYNKANGAFRQNDTKDRALIFYQVEPATNTTVQKSVEDIAKQDIVSIPGVVRAHYVDMRGFLPV